MKIQTKLLIFVTALLYSSLLNAQCDDFIVDYVGLNDCTESGTFFAEILIDNPDGINFEAYIDGDLIGIFDYGEEVYSFGPYVGDCSTIRIFTIVDIENECESSITLEPICCEAYCSISDIVVDPADCTGDGTYEIYLDFTYDEVEEDVFDLFTNGSYFGTYAYADLPLTISEFPDGPDDLDFIAILGTGADVLCADDYAFEGLDCASSECTISEVYAEAYACDELGEIFVDIEFDYTNPGPSGQFTISGNGTTYGTFGYGQTFYTVGPFSPDCNTLLEFVITDVDEPDCNDFYVFDEVICCEEGECEMTALDFGANPNCDNNMVFAEWLILGENVSEVGYDIFVNDIFETFVQYDESNWYYFGIENPGVEVFVLKACDNDNPDCCISIEIENPCFSAECSIDNLIAEVYDCNDQGEIYFDIAFEVINPGADNMFTVVGNGNDYGTFTYGESFYTVGPFEADCETIPELIITDVNDNDCSAVAILDSAPCCEEGECEITALDFGANPNCDNNIVFAEWLILGENVSEVGYDIFVNDVFETFVQYDESNWYYFGIENPGAEVFVLKACDNDNPDCCISIEVENPCFSAECSINNLIAEVHDCNDQGEVYFDIAFEIVNPGADNMFSVVGNGNDYGTFEYGESFYTIGPFMANCETLPELIVTDVNDNDCYAVVEFADAPCCENPECEIFDLEVVVGDCIDNTFIAIVGFEYANVTGDFYDLFVNGEFYGFYAYADLPLTISGLSYDTEYVTFEVNDNDNETCSTGVEVLNPCYEENEECTISGLEAEMYSCDEEGLIYFDIWFDISNPGPQNLFSVAGNGNDYGTFEYGQDFYTVGPFEADCETIPEIVVYDVGDELCADDFGFDWAPCCESTECSITELVVETSECDDDQFSITIDFAHSGTENSFFDLWINGDYYQSYEYEDLPLTIDGLSYDGEIVVIDIIDTDDESCSAALDLINPCYDEESCSITGLEAEMYACDEVGLIYFDIWFNYSNPGPDNQFVVAGNGNQYGTFEYGQDFYTVGPFEVDCETVPELVVYDLNDESCADDMSFDTAPCCDEEECIIADLNVDATECNDESFGIVINFDYTNVTNDFFDLYIQGEYYQTYAYEILPLTIDGLSYDDQILIIEIHDNDNPDCGSEVEIFNPCHDNDGTGNCLITNVEVEAGECNDEGEVYFLLTFDYSDVGPSNLFEVVGNGNNYGTYEYGLDAYEIGPIEADCETELEFVVVDVDDESCAAFTGHDPICCEDENDCFFESLSISLSPCDDEVFDLEIDFDFDGTSNEFFDLSLNGEFYSSYLFEDLPITLENLNYESDDITLEICENDNEQCCVALTFINPCATDEICYIDDMEVDNTNCIDDLVSAIIDFDYGSGNSSSFSVSGNGVDYGSFDYSDLPITVEGLEGDGETFYEFEVTDDEDESCAGLVVLGTVNCNNMNMEAADEEQTDLFSLEEEVALRDQNKIQSITAYDINGRLLGHYSADQLRQNFKTLDLQSSVSAGLVILRIDYGDEILMKKIIRVH